MKQEAEAGAAARLAELKNALEQVKKNGELPTNLEEKESFFMNQVALGESLCASEGKLHPLLSYLDSERRDRDIGYTSGTGINRSLIDSPGSQVEAAIAFWKALKVYPQPQVSTSHFDVTYSSSL